VSGSVLSHFAGVRRSGDGWTAKCPAHDDRRSSLSIGRGDTQPWVLKCHAGCAVDAILEAAHLTMPDLLTPSRRVNGHRSTVATYDYRDEQGTLLYQICRMEPKDFRQRRPDGHGGWIWKLGTVRRVLYRLPELARQTVVYITEGEKDVDRLWSLGVPATTNAGGAGKWRPEYAQQLCAAGVTSVAILPDNDAAGQSHAVTVARRCHAAGLQVKVIALAGLKPKGDVSDWLDAGYTRDDLVTLVKAAALYTAKGSITATAPEDDLALTGIRDLLSEPEDSIEWLVADRFACGSLNLLAGKPKAGKSTLARYLAYCIATSTPFLGHRVMGGAVWCLVLEDKRSEVRRHFRALGATGAEPIRFVFGTDPDLLPKLARLAERERPAAIIVDTLQRLIGAKDLNDYAEVTTKLTPIIALARTTAAALILVHHAGKAERAGIDNVLGSTALAGSVDNIFFLNRTERYRVFSSIQRIGPDLPDTVLTLDAGRCVAGGSRHEADVAHLQTAMLAALEREGTLTRADWLDACEGRRQIKLEALRRLVTSGTTIRSGAGSKADPYRYSVARDSDGGSQVPSNSREPESVGSLFSTNPNSSIKDCGSQVPIVPEVPREPAKGDDDVSPMSSMTRESDGEEWMPPGLGGRDGKW
jgi:putative DNA primase/helicase